MAMNVKRLEMLIEVLAEVPRKKFTLDMWMAPYHVLGSDDPAYRKPTSEDDVWWRPTHDNNKLWKAIKGPKTIDLETFYAPMDCKTAGCAMGWAASNKKFNRLGLFLSEWVEPVHIDKKGRKHIEMDAACSVFNFHYTRTADRLFYRESYSKTFPTPNDVIKKIKKLIDLGEEKFLIKEGTAKEDLESLSVFNEDL